MKREAIAEATQYLAQSLPQAVAVVVTQAQQVQGLQVVQAAVAVIMGTLQVVVLLLQLKVSPEVQPHQL
jgi:hypothetical protein